MSDEYPCPCVAVEPLFYCATECTCPVRCSDQSGDCTPCACESDCKCGSLNRLRRAHERATRAKLVLDKLKKTLGNVCSAIKEAEDKVKNKRSRPVCPRAADSPPSNKRPRTETRLVDVSEMDPEIAKELEELSTDVHDTSSVIFGC